MNKGQIKEQLQISKIFWCFLIKGFDNIFFFLKTRKAFEIGLDPDKSDIGLKITGLGNKNKGAYVRE